MLNLTKSTQAFQEAQQVLPGGVNSPVRSYQNIGFAPPFIASAKGSKIFDIDGNEYIDYIGSWGPMVVGHAHPEVVQALNQATARGTSYGAPTLAETALAKKIMTSYPCVQKIRMVNSGTEATMSALRVARGYTKRDKIIKFIGCYHGHVDSLLVQAGSGLATFSTPSSPGITAGTAQDTISLPYNDIATFRATMQKYGPEIAAVIVEPVAGNMGVVLPKDGFLQALREETSHYQSVLIFDEVMCGFRASAGGAVKKYHITPDLVCFGKIIGGGLPVAAYGGKNEIMQVVSPLGPVYQAGTLSGNPLAMAAGLATLNILTEPQKEYQKYLETQTTKLLAGLQELAKELAIPLITHQAGSMFSIFFSEQDIWNYDDAAAANQIAFKEYFKIMLENGIYIPPSQFETLFMSIAHTNADIEKTLSAAKKALLTAKKFL